MQGFDSREHPFVTAGLAKEAGPSVFGLFGGAAAKGLAGATSAATKGGMRHYLRRTLPWQLGAAGTLGAAPIAAKHLFNPAGSAIPNTPGFEFDVPDKGDRFGTLPNQKWDLGGGTYKAPEFDAAGNPTNLPPVPLPIGVSKTKVAAHDKEAGKLDAVLQFLRLGSAGGRALKTTAMGGRGLGGKALEVTHAAPGAGPVGFAKWQRPTAPNPTAGASPPPLPGTGGFSMTQPAAGPAIVSTSNSGGSALTHSYAGAGQAASGSAATGGAAAAQAAAKNPSGFGRFARGTGLLFGGAAMGMAPTAAFMSSRSAQAIEDAARAAQAATLHGLRNRPWYERGMAVLDPGSYYGRAAGMNDKVRAFYNLLDEANPTGNKDFDYAKYVRDQLQKKYQGLTVKEFSNQ